MSQRSCRSVLPTSRPRALALRAAALAIAVAAAACAPDPATAPRAAADAALSASRGADGGAAGLPARYVLPGAAAFPEGIAVDARAGTVYVSSIADGTVFRGDLRDTVLAPFLAPGADGRTVAAGLDVDAARGRLYVAGGATGRVFVYDARSGALLANLLAAPGTAPTTVNDVAVAPDGAVYVTDSNRPVLYRVTSDRAGAFRVEPWLDLTGTAVRYEAGFNLNGIVVTPDGRYLFVSQTNTGQLFRIDVRARTVAEVDLGGERLPGADGMFLRGAALHVVQNAQAAVAEVRLQGFGPGAPRGRVVARLTDPGFRVPTAVREVRGRLLVVNSQFDRLTTGAAPETPFTVSVVAAPGGADEAPAPAPARPEDQVVALLEAFETGDLGPLSVINPDKFIQHNLGLPDGVAGVTAFIQSLTPGTLRIDVPRVFRDGDYVVAHSAVELSGSSIVLDVFRYEAGRIVEHWDNIQPAAGPNPSGRTMIDGATEVRDLHRTTANKALVRRFTTEVLMQGRIERLDRYFDQGRYIQHNPRLADGVPALRAFLQSLAAQGALPQSGRIHALLGEGNFVLVIRDGVLGGQPAAFYDLYRLENGKIAEHWDVLQAIPPQSEWRNANGKFGFDDRLARP